MPAHPDPTFHASARSWRCEAPPEKVAYTVMLSPDFSQPDGLAVVDVDPGSKSFGKIVHTVIMPNKGDEFHHFGWNACSSALSPLAGHAFLERRYLSHSGYPFSRIYVVDTKPDPTKAKDSQDHRAGGSLRQDRLFAASHHPLRPGRHLCFDA